MSDGAKVKLTGPWGAFAKAVDPAVFRPALEGNLTMANERIGRQFVARARRMIRAKNYAPNSPMTIILKGSSTPLVRGGDLFQQITFDVVDPYTVRVGVMRARAGDKLVNIGLILHEGATIDVSKHPQVRRKVWSLVRQAIAGSGSLRGASKKAVVSAATSIGLGGTGKAKKKKAKLTGKALARFWASQPKTGPAGGGKKIWVIPARPFLAAPLGEASFRNFAIEQWSRAVKATFLGIAKKAGGK